MRVSELSADQIANGVIDVAGFPVGRFLRNDALQWIVGKFDCAGLAGQLEADTQVAFGYSRESSQYESR